MGDISYLDTILVPTSLFLLMGYHAYLWHIFKKNPSSTSSGADRRASSMWVLSIQQDYEKKGILAVQSLRNSQMSTILSATMGISVYIALAALANNTYNAAHILKNPFFGTQSALLIVLKFSLVSLILLLSFLCSTMALGFLIEANFILNLSTDDFLPGYPLAVFDRGFVLAFLGNRALCVSFPLLLWMLGPVPLVLSSVALVWVLYKFDFVGEGKKELLLL
ncbi:uncharacterized protein LOC122090173 [Macadamia integrifolia]|uniref:uncharacterized protein LOC122090173 n=1 Tax=Macadamia integrifolia TaxID=60698 RepID=UPI001C4E7E9F|nr:uncharacterized protein LOC122090173 [Macadamia integrifolia]